MKDKNHHDDGHSHGHNHIHSHGHFHEEGHGHRHSEEHTKRVLNRLARASGHLQSVIKMVEKDQDCSDVLVQLAAVIAALKNTGKLILEEHIETCIVDAVTVGDQQSIDDLKKAIDRFVK